MPIEGFFYILDTKRELAELSAGRLKRLKQGSPVRRKVG